MIKNKAFILRKMGDLINVTNEPLYIIKYQKSVLYVGRCMAKQKKFRQACRIANHFDYNLEGCERAWKQSGASRQMSNMVKRLPQEVVDQFTIILLQPHEILNFCDLQNQALRLKMIANGITIDDIKRSKRMDVVDFCEKALAWSLCPTFCKAGYCDCTSGIPESLIEFLTT